MEDKLEIKIKTPCQCECHNQEGIVHITPCCEGETTLWVDYKEWIFLQEFYRNPLKRNQNKFKY